jgi:hypothetical protein
MFLSNVQWTADFFGKAAFPSLPHHWTVDDRIPLFTFDCNSSNSNGDAATAAVTTYGVFLFSLPLWTYMLCCTLLACALAVPSAILIYSVILQPQQKQQSKVKLTEQQTQLKQPRYRTQWTTPRLGHVLGWCVLLPAWIVAPGPLMRLFRVEHLVLRFCLCVITPTVSIFRLLEALYGFTPQHARASRSAFVLHYCSPMLLQQDPKTDKAAQGSWTDRISHLLWFLACLVVTGLYQSLFANQVPSFFPQYGQGPESTPPHYFTPSSILDVAIWRDSLLVAVLLQLYLSCFSEGLIFATMVLTGHKLPKKFMDNPLVASTSPGDFWGRRWNLVIHTCLKNGVYKLVLLVHQTRLGAASRGRRCWPGRRPPINTTSSLQMPNPQSTSSVTIYSQSTNMQIRPMLRMGALQ